MTCPFTLRDATGAEFRGVAFVHHVRDLGSIRLGDPVEALLVPPQRKRDNGLYKVKKLHFPNGPETWEESIIKRYGSVTEYNRQLRARRTADRIADTMAVVVRNEVAEKESMANYRVYKKFRDIRNERQFTPEEADELLEALRGSLRQQDKLRAESARWRGMTNHFENKAKELKEDRQ